MTLDEIYECWHEDSQVDKSELGNAALETAKLHHKYYRMFSQERLLLKKLESDMKVLKLEKFEHYTEGPTQESFDKGWKLPARGKVLKNAANEYIDADGDIIALNLKIAYQQEKCNVIESIIKVIMNRGYQIRAAIDWEKFKVGG